MNFMVGGCLWRVPKKDDIASGFDRCDRSPKEQ